MVFVGDLLARHFDVANSQIEPFARPSELLPRFLHGMMLAQRAPLGRATIRHRTILLNGSLGSNYSFRGYKKSRWLLWFCSVFRTKANARRLFAVDNRSFGIERLHLRLSSVGENTQYPKCGDPPHPDQVRREDSLP